MSDVTHSGIKVHNNSSVRRQKDLTGYCFKYIDRPYCLRTDDMYHKLTVVTLEIITGCTLVKTHTSARCVAVHL